MRRISFRIIFTLCMIVLTLSLCTVGSFAAKNTAEKDSIVSVTLKKDLSSAEIKCVFTEGFVKQNKGQMLYLFELAPYQSAGKLTQYTAVAEAKCSAAVTFKIKYAENTSAQLFDKYVIAAKNADGNYTIVTDARYADNISVGAERIYPFPDKISAGMPLKKGLVTDMYADAQELGISHTIIDVPVNELLTGSGGSGVQTYEWDGKTCYIDSLRLARLDKQVSVMTDAGVNVYLRIVLSGFENNPDETLRCLYYPESFESAEMYAFNVKDTDSVKYMEGIIRFLAQRYTAEDSEYGFSGSFILGRNVNSNRTWYSMGNASLDTFLNSYTAAFRICDTALRSVYANGRVYLPLDNNFNVPCSDSVSADPELDYSAKAFLEGFNTKMTDYGNIPWRLAVNASPSDKTSAKFWDDQRASQVADSEFLTMKNISVLCDMMNEEKYQYDSMPRSILISEFATVGEIAAVAEGSTEAAGDTTLLQSASWAYAYYTAYFNSQIEAIIYGEQLDNPNSPIKRGLWTSSLQPDENGVSTVRAESKKPVYNLFKYIDTSRSAELTASSLSRIGATGWAELVPGYDSEKIDVRKLTETIPILAADIGKGYKTVSLFDFAGGTLRNFVPSDNTDYIELRAEKSVDGGNALYAAMSHYYPNEYMGISYASDADENPQIDLKNVKYITMHVKVDAPEGMENVNVMFRLQRGGNAESGTAVYEGTAQVKANKWQDITFKLDDFADGKAYADTLKLWARSSEGKESGGSYGLWLSQISAYKKEFPAILKFIIIVVISVAVIVAAFFIFVAYRNITYQRKKKQHRAEMLRRHDEEMRRRRPK